MTVKANRPRVLLVDDYPDAREMYAEYLEYSGFEVVEAGNGAEALQRAIDTSPDIILMDVDLPVINGWEAIRRLRADPRTSGIPILLLTCSTREDLAERAEEAGCDAVVSKPRRPSDLVNDVRKVLECARRQQLVER